MDQKALKFKTILNYKKQIILQGPPGTGKTYTAKDIAEEMIFNQITKDKEEQKSKLELTEQFKLIQFHPAYSYEDFVRGITAKANDKGIVYEVENKVLADFALQALQNWKEASQLNDSTNAKPFVLIIDEINRANLPAVLGELIYALEYRGEKVETMYTFKNDKYLILPPNLFIIGTMNTADRSVGHIDYAIRRRFAYIDILPSQKPVHLLAQSLFRQVSELFITNYDTLDWDNPKLERAKYLAYDFRPEDIWVGHSYFISLKETDDEVKAELQLKLQYEIKPLLKEYLKDGILLTIKNESDSDLTQLKIESLKI